MTTEQLIFENDYDKLFFESLISKYNLGIDIEYLEKIREFLKIKSLSEALLYSIWYKLGEGLGHISEEYTDAVSWITVKYYFMENITRPVGFYCFDDVQDFAMWLDVKDVIRKNLDEQYLIYLDIFEKLLINNKTDI